MISLRMYLTVSLLFLIFISGVVAQNGWSVNYYHTSICALKGSTVDMRCTYTYPSDHSVSKAFWTKVWPKGGVEPPDLSDDPDYKGRVQYPRDAYRYSTLRLRDVTEKDQIKYYFRFITDTNKYQGRDGVYLFVTDLQVEVPETVMEGDKVTLTCKTTCRLTDSPTFTWYRNRQHLSYGSELYLQKVSKENKNKYQCGVLDQKLFSPEVTLNVRYGPKSVSVSISPSGEIIEDSSVTLTCSSDGNPPVNKYTWFIGTSLVATGEIYTFNKIRSVDSGEYKCRSSNEHGDKDSDTVTINVLYPPKRLSVSISPSGEIMEGSSVTLTCNSDANPPVQNYTWFKKILIENQQKCTQQIYNILNISSADSGEYQCMATNTKGSQSSEYKSLTVLYPPKRVSVSISETLENSSVTLTCNSDANPPVQNYTWFKEGGSSPVGSGHSYSALQSGSFYCVAQNKYGSQTSAVVTVTVKDVKIVVLYEVLGAVAGCGCLSLVIVVLYLRRKRNEGDTNVEQENIYSSVAERSSTTVRTSDPDLSNQDDVQYASVVKKSRKAESSAVRSSGFETDEEVQYSTVQHKSKKVIKKTEEDDVQYASVRFTRPGATNRSAASTLEDFSAIYSSVK